MKINNYKREKCWNYEQTEDKVVRNLGDLCRNFKEFEVSINIGFVYMINFV